MSDSTALTVGKTFSLAPTSLGEAMKYADMIAKTSMVPKGLRGDTYDQTSGNILVAVQMGGEVGLSPMQAIQNIAVINGLPSIWGDAMVAVCMAHPMWNGIDQTFDPDSLLATCTVERKGQKSVTRSFSWTEAERAGLVSKDTYQKYPQRMLAARARAWALRDAFPDALKGLNSAEEIIDLPRDAYEVKKEEPAKPSDKPTTGMGALDAALDNAKPEPEVEAKPDPEPDSETDKLEDEMSGEMLDWKQKMDDATDEATLETVGLELYAMEDCPLKTMLRSYYKTRLKEMRGVADGQATEG